MQLAIHDGLIYGFICEVTPGSWEVKFNIANDEDEWTRAEYSRYTCQNISAVPQLYSEVKAKERFLRDFKHLFKQNVLYGVKKYPNFI